jgi:excisionase family DNA binding protein
MDKKWMNYQEAMSYLGVSRSTLDLWRRDGRLTFAKLPNGQLRIRMADLDSWLEELVVA